MYRSLKGMEDELCILSPPPRMIQNSIVYNGECSVSVSLRFGALQLMYQEETPAEESELSCARREYD